MSLMPESFRNIVEDFQDLPDDLLLEMLVVRGSELPALKSDEKIPGHLVPGCTSVVYVVSDFTDGKLEFRGEADSLIVRGYVSILVEGLSGLPVDDVVNAESWMPDFIKSARLNVSLTPSRSNAFFNIFTFMRRQARSWQKASSTQ